MKHKRKQFYPSGLVSITFCLSRISWQSELENGDSQLNVESVLNYMLKRSVFFFRFWFFGGFFCCFFLIYFFGFFICCLFCLFCFLFVLFPWLVGFFTPGIILQVCEILCVLFLAMHCTEEIQIVLVGSKYHHYQIGFWNLFCYYVTFYSSH